MTIWALKGPSSDDYDQEEYSKVLKYLSDSIRKGTSRFGWGYVDTADLKKLQDKPWQEMTSEEQNCWSKANFLLEVKKGDWVVHINLPYWGACFAGQVIGEYSFARLDEDGVGDYGHTLKLDPKSIVEFERNDNRVLPIISSRLKLQGGHWRIHCVEEFLQTIQNIKAGPLGKKEKESVGIFYLKQDLSPLLKEITKKIQKAHPAGKLESFIAEVLRKVPNVISVTEHGKHKGWGTDNGADLIVAYKSGLSFSNLEKEEKDLLFR